MTATELATELSTRLGVTVVIGGVVRDEPDAPYFSGVTVNGEAITKKIPVRNEGDLLLIGDTSMDAHTAAMLQVDRDAWVDFTEALFRSALGAGGL